MQPPAHTIKLLYQHAGFIIVHKPSGIASQGDIEQIGICQRVFEQFAIRCFPCHRLDKATSGLMLLATNEQSNSQLSSLFAQQKIQKLYLAIAAGKPKKKQGWVIGDMQKSRRSQYKLLRSKDNPAKTHFISQAISAGKRLYLLKPLSGKTHQLRVALASLGCPILGDDLYGDKTATPLHLHAWQLSFEYQNAPFNFVSDPNRDEFLTAEAMELIASWQLHGNPFAAE